MKIRLPHLLCLALSATLAASAYADTFALSFNADESSRWHDFIMDWFAELDRTEPDTPPLNILYSISAEADPLAPAAYADTGERAVVFAHGRAFTNIGSLHYNGSGNGTFPVTAVTLDVNPYVQSEGASALGLSYLTTVTNAQGTITIVNGTATDIQLDADIRFEFDARQDPLIGHLMPYDGTFSIHGDRFDLFVDDEYGSHFVMRYVWDLHGNVDRVGNADLIFANGFE